MNLLSLLLVVGLHGQLAPSADPRPIPISGVVLDAAGKPAAEVDVWLIDALTPDAFRLCGDEVGREPFGEANWGLPPVVLSTRTDATGRFSLQVPAGFAARRWQCPLALVVFKAGTGIITNRLSAPLSAEYPDVRLTLAPAVEGKVLIVDPQGKPVAGAEVVPRVLDDMPVPHALGRALGGKTDSQGGVVIRLPARLTLQEIQVKAAGLGIQRLRVDAQAEQALALAPVARVTGRLVASRPGPIQGVTIRAFSQEGGYAGSGRSGVAEATCDSSGRFEIPAITAGLLKLELHFDPVTGPIMRPEPSHGVVVAAGTTTELTVPLHPAVRVKGLIRQKEANRPIAGVLVTLDGMFGGDQFAVTDREGQFVGVINRENFQPYGWAIRVPSPFFIPSVRKDKPQRMPPPGTDELVLPPDELPRAVDVPGMVKDQAGRGICGATVEGTWRHATGRTQFVISRSDAQGHFVLHGVDPVAELTYRAWLGDRSMARSVTARAVETITRPVVVTISSKFTSSLVGRVQDTAGRPIAGALVRVWRMARGKDRRVVDIEPILSEDGHDVVRTDSSGRYQAPRRVSLPDEFFAEVRATGRLSDQSRIVVVTRPGEEISPVTLRRVLTLSGQVVDRQGQPIPGALVRQSGDGAMPTSTTTDEQGWFHLPGVLDGHVVLFVQKTDFQTEPHVVTARGDPCKVVLAHASDPGSVSYKMIPPALSADEAKTLIHRLIEPLSKRVLEQGSEHDKSQLMDKLAEIDPSWALELLPSVKLSDPDELNGIRSIIAGVLLHDDPDEAAAVIESINDPGRRAWAYIASARDQLKQHPARAREQIDLALLNARAMDPRGQMLAAETVIDVLIDLGQIDRARELFKEQRKRIESLYTGAVRTAVLTRFVIASARIDPTAALAEFETLRREYANQKDARRAVFGRYMERMASELADRSPADAERLLKEVLSTGESIRVFNNSILSICSKMAAVDLPRARRLADLVAGGEIEKQPYALGLMAQALAKTNKPAAQRLLDEAFTELEQLRTQGRASQFASISATAGGLLPIVEQVDASRLPEYVARALALRPSRWQRNDDSYIREQNAQLAMMISRYDRELAARVIKPDLQEVGTLSLALFGADIRTYRTVCGLALVDPSRAVKLATALPESSTTNLVSISMDKNRVLLEVANLLALHGDNLWRHVYDRFLLLTPPDLATRR